MANNKDFILKSAIEVGGSTSMTIGSAPTVGSVTVGYDDANNWTYASITYDSSAENVTPIGNAFKPDGTKMYVLGHASPATVFEYDLSTAWDVSSAGFTSGDLYDISPKTTDPEGFAFKPDGTEMYIITTQSDNVHQYTLSTPWVVSSASFTRTKSVSSANSLPAGIAFNNDGTKMYTLGHNSPAGVFEWDLSTAWDISSAVYNSVQINSTSTNSEGTPFGISFNSDGTKLWFYGSNTDLIYQYSMSTAFSLSTATYNSINFNPASQTTTAYGISFGDSGTKLYVTGTNEDSVFQYNSGYNQVTNTFDVSTGNYFADTPSVSAQYDFSNAGDTQTFQLEVTGNQVVVGYDLSNAAYDSVVSPALSSTLGTGQGLFFKPDGTKVYANDGTTLFQYGLSTAWDISTIVYESKSFTIPAGGSNVNDPWDCFFKPDGTIVYFVSRGSSEIFAFGLGTAWDVSTGNSTYLSKLSSTGTSPNSVFFKPDGTKMYIIAGNDDVKGYSLTTAWDLSSISSGTYTTFHAGNQIATPRTLDFSSDGLKMYIAGTNPTKVFEYDLSTAWDASSSSVSYNSIDLALSTYPSYPYGLFFKTDGTKMYVLGGTTDIIHQYTTAGSTGITITWDADIEWAGGTAPDSPANGEKDLYTITTDDAGASYVGIQSGDNFS